MTYVGYFEEWKLLKNFKKVKNNIYEVSNYGDVRIKETKERVTFKVANKKKHPYYAVYLEMKNGKKEWVLVHQLVAHCFLKIPKRYKNVPKENLVPDHLDNNGLNNFYLNLEIKTHGENTKAAFERKEINTTCENSVYALISNTQAEKICQYLSEEKSYDEILQLLNLPNEKKYRQLLVRIKNRLAWNEISQKYDFSSKTKLTPQQEETVAKIPLINELINKGYSNIEIFNEIYPDGSKKESRTATIRKIRRKEIYKDYL